jgi:nucleoside-diphosphate-sugar epimerase
MRVLGAAREAAVATVIVASSIRVGDALAAPEEERDPDGAQSPRQVEAYAFGKLVCEQYAEQTASSASRTVVVRLGGVRGPGLDYGSAPEPPPDHLVPLSRVMTELIHLPARDLPPFSRLTLVGSQDTGHDHTTSLTDFSGR